MPTEPTTLEEARAEILRLDEELKTARTEIENYTTKVNELNKNLEDVRELNQQYYLKLRAQDESDEDEDPEEDVPSCEDFARTLTI